MSELGTHFPPINEWTTVDHDGNIRLVDPIDGAYDPNHAPSYVQNDPELSVGLAFLADNVGRIKVNLSLGPSQAYEDLGDFNWFEQHVAEVDSLGHNLSADTPENGYAYRIIAAIQDPTLARHEYTHVPSSESTTAGAITILGMRDYVQGSFDELDRLSKGNVLERAFAEDAESYTMAASTLVMNAAQWHSAAQVGLAAKETVGRDLGVHETWSSLVVADPLGADLYRKLHLMGAQVAETPYRRNEHTWNLDDDQITSIIRSGII
jgi:hypothetical protein